MEVDNTKLIKLLFKNEFSESWINDVEFNKYISKIGMYNVEELLKEPNRLNDENNSVLEQTQELAFKNYKTFVQTADCSRKVFKQFTDTEKRLDLLIEKIPTMEKQCEKFLNTTKNININRKLNSLTLTRNAQLLEILELPQLMESFIYDEQYENALELANYARRLLIKHPDINIFKKIVIDIEKSWMVMLHQLIALLKLDLQLPKCLQIIGYLRRMQAFNEAELRIKFLQARDTWLQNSLAAISRDDVNHHLNKIIEVTRINLFSIVTQYRAIFNDDEHNPVNATRNVNENLIFYSWLHEKIILFIDALKTDLKSGQILSIDSILSQCMYFGLSFSRVGCDFRGLLVPVFTETIRINFENAITKATKDLEKNMERFTLINKSGVKINYKSETSNLHPPETLLEFYPLAEYCNQILTGLNDLRLCAPFGIVTDIVKKLQDSIIIVSRTILVFFQQEQQAFTLDSKEAFGRLCICFADDLIPYLQQCLHIIYPPVNVATHLGISVQILNRQGFVSLDRNELIKPIAHLLPKKIEPVLSEPVLDIASKSDDNKEDKQLFSN